MPKQNIVCKVGTNGVLFTYKVDRNGKKKRVTNDNATQCNTLPVCRNTCDSSKVDFPCKKKNTVFTKKKDYDQYCSIKKKSHANAPYMRAKRKSVAKRANASLEKSQAALGIGSKPKKVMFKD